MTHTATLVLGLLAERPAGPYELIKILEQVNIRRWYKVSDASIYLAVRKLEDQGYLEGRPVREGNNPEKTVYSISEKGNKVLLTTLMSYLESPESPKEAIDIAILLLCHIPKDLALDVLERRTLSLQVEIERASELLASMSGSKNYPFIAISMVRHSYLVKNALLETLKELHAAASREGRWNYFVAGN